MIPHLTVSLAPASVLALCHRVLRRWSLYSARHALLQRAKPCVLPVAGWRGHRRTPNDGFAASAAETISELDETPTYDAELGFGRKVGTLTRAAQECPVPFGLAARGGRRP
jgi:hypothetical protein